MKITVIAPPELDPSLQARWRSLQEAQPLLASPYFTPDFTLAVGAVRNDVRVAVIEDAGHVAGFFPFQQQWGGGLPVAGRLSDHHGVIADPAFRWDWHELLRTCRLGYWQFDHLPAPQRPGDVQVHLAMSPGLDLSRGFEAYRAARMAAGGRRMGELPRKGRKLEREVGPVRFEAHSRDSSALARVIQLKSEQCRRTGALDCFAPTWARELVERIAATDLPHFGGRLSTLHAGDTLVAAHFGMRSSRVWHWWFPVYSRDHGAYSPGAQLLMSLAEKAAAEGHALLDLGKGDEAYKDSFADTGTALAAGIVSRHSPITYLRAARKSTGRWLRASPIARPLLRQLGRLGPGAIVVPGMLMLAADPA